MPRNIEMQHAPTTVADDEKAAEDAEGYGWHSEEIHGGNGFSVIPQKRTPSLGGLWICCGSSHPTGNRPLGNIEPKHPEFAVDTRRAPGWVLDRHAKDQIPHPFGESLPAYPSRSPQPTVKIRRPAVASQALGDLGQFLSQYRKKFAQSVKGRRASPRKR
jgi:hypothetical protein